MAVRWLFLALLALATAAGVGSLADSDLFNCTVSGCREKVENSTAGYCDNATGECDCSLNVFGENITCFTNVSNYCALDRCYRYDEEEGRCLKGARSRTTALCLSIFLINFGAANFYIQRYELAIPQIIIGLLLCVFQVGACAAACLRDDEISVSCVICCGINSVVSLLLFAWWLADLIIFALNTRLDGNGCVLYT